MFGKERSSIADSSYDNPFLYGTANDWHDFICFLHSLKDRFDYGLNPEKLGAVSSYLCDPATAHAEFMLVKNQYLF